MKTIMTEIEYYELLRRGRQGHYPRVLTTDGYKFGQEYHANHDGWRADDYVIAYISRSDDWPTYKEATKKRIAIKKQILAQEATK